MPTYRTIQAAALITTLAVTSAGAGTIGGEQGPNQVIELMETPPTLGSCKPPVATISGLTTSYPTITLTVRNRTFSTYAQDALVLTVVDGGKYRMFWVPIDLRARSTASVTITFRQRLDSTEVSLCGNRPDQITDDPMPIGTVQIVDEGVQ